MLRFEPSIWIIHEDDDCCILTVSAPEELLLRHGLLSAETAASIPPCGTSNQPGRRVTRGKSRTRVDAWIADEFLGLIASVLVPAMCWSPGRAAGGC